MIVVDQQRMRVNRRWEDRSGHRHAGGSPHASFHEIIRLAMSRVVMVKANEARGASLPRVLAWMSRRIQGDPTVTNGEGDAETLGLVMPLSATVAPSHGAEDPEHDRSLMRRVVAHDEDAFAALYDRYAAQVNGVTWSILRSPALAEEATHDVFLRLWQQPAAFDPARGTFAGWLMRVARNRAIDVLRRRREDTGGGLAGDVTSWIVDPAPGPEEQAIDRLGHQEVQQALSELGTDHRQLLELAYFAGMSQTQIAEYLGRPLGTVKSQIRAAMGRLADRLVRPSGSPVSDSSIERETRR